MAKTTEDLQKEAAQKDYKQHVAAVQDLATMTRTRGWREQIWPNAQAAYDQAHVAFNDEETKPSEFKILQRDCIMFAGLQEAVEGPVDAMAAFVNSMPLFREIMPQTATFDAEHGTVALVDSSPADPEGEGEE